MSLLLKPIYKSEEEYRHRSRQAREYMSKSGDVIFNAVREICKLDDTIKKDTHYSEVYAIYDKMQVIAQKAILDAYEWLEKAESACPEVYRDANGFPAKNVRDFSLWSKKGKGASWKTLKVSKFL